MIAESKTEDPPSEKYMMAYSKYLKSDEALAALRKCEVNQKLLWDLGGQERYLASHAALMPAESEYTVCMYLLVIDISKDLNEMATSSFRSGEASPPDVPLELLNIKYNKDFPCHWFTSIGICHPSDERSEFYLGKDLDVHYPAILIAATRIDEVERRSDSEDFLNSQNKELHKLIYDLKCEDHVVKNGEDPQNERWFFPVDNTKSGKTEIRCEGVRTIMSKLDGSSKHYWSEKNKRRSMPVKWVHFELSLVMKKGEKIIGVDRAIEISRQSKIDSDEEALSALKFIHSLGAIFYFWDVTELKQYVIVNPEWLIDTVATFVTAKEPTGYGRHWRRLCETGETSKNVVLKKLEELNVKSRDQKDSVLNVLNMLDIICESPEDSSTLLIPCMVTKMPTESLVWEEYSPSQKFPPPIVIFPDEVQTIPEGFFFRIVTKFARKYPGARELSRNRSIFRIGNSNLKLELLYYDRGTCLIVSMTGEGDMENAVSSVPKSAPEIREFVADSVEGAKKRGMSGLKLAYYWQVANKRVFESHVDTGKASCRLPRNGSLVTVQLRDRGVCSPGPPDSLFCVSKVGDVCSTKEQREFVHRWYKKEVQII